MKIMKKYLLKFFLMAAVAVSISAAAEAQFVVRIRPVAPVIRVRPVCPSPRHAWVNGEYVWRGDQYVYTEGYWSMPPRPGLVWIEGHWKDTRRGWKWVPGHWR